MELDKIIALINAVSDSTLTNFVLDEGNLHLELQKVSNIQATLVQNTAQISTAQLQKEGIVSSVTEEEPISSELTGTPVCSPLVGTFYSAPSEKEPPFVKVGDTVKKGQVLGIIEAMKLMNEIESEQDGVITAVLVENGQMVEYGQKLFLIQEG